MQKLEEYFKLQKEIHDYFSYVEDWAVIPINDATEMYWQIIGDENGGVVRFAEKKETFDTEGDYYEDEIYTQRHLPKWVYRAKDFTMICVDTRTDGNKFLQVFDNAKELKTEAARET